MAFGMWLPYSPLAFALSLTALPPFYWPILLATLVCYMALTRGLRCGCCERIGFSAMRRSLFEKVAWSAPAGRGSVFTQTGELGVISVPEIAPI